MKRINLVLLPVVLILAGCVTVEPSPVEVGGVVVKAEESASEVEAAVERKADGYLLPDRAGKIDFTSELGRKENGFSIWRSFGATLCVLGALIALNLYIRKGKFPGAGRAGKRIKLIEKHALDQKKSLMLFEVDGRTVLVGVGAEGISRIMELDDAGDFEEELGGQLTEAGTKEEK